MGGDGGSIPKRIELVKSRQKPEQVAKEAGLAARWRHCQLSQELLTRPIVACQLGRMYNKTAALEFLLDREKYGTSGAFDHIRSLRDLKELRLSDNPEGQDKASSSTSSGAAASASAAAAAPYSCPLSGVEMNGRFRFLFSWSCGCVLAEKAVDCLVKKQQGSLSCPVCQQPDAMSDLIVLNPSSDAEIAAATEAMTARKRRLRQESKNVGKSTKRKLPAELPSAATSSKLARPGTSASSSSSSSIQNDPNASAALKSLFTSSKEAKSQEKAHWVTFNPGYFR